MTITKNQFIEMLATLVAGLYANPANGSLAQVGYQRIQIVVDEHNNLKQALMQLGITIEDA
jgi:hypothetical protein